MNHNAFHNLQKPFIVISFLILFNIGDIWTGPAALSDTMKAPEYLIKAGYLYKYFFFFEWPVISSHSNVDDKNLIIGIIGDDSFEGYFDPIQGKMIKNLNKKVKIKRFGLYRRSFNPDGCHILFICKSEKKNIDKILTATREKPILTVADQDGFLEKGGMINLVNLGDLIRWEINLKSIEKSGLTVSATIVQSAVKVLKD